MNKQDLINAIAEKIGISKKAAGEAVDAVTGEISTALANGDTVSLVGFGSFKTSKRAARTGRNPQTGDPVQIPAKSVPVFTASSVLKNAVNK